MGTAPAMSRFGGSVGASDGQAAELQATRGLLEEEEEVDFQNQGDDDLSRRLEGLGFGPTDDGDGVGLYHLADASAICGGRVGNVASDHRICLKADGECLASTHQATRDEDLLEGLVGKVLVRTKPGGGAKAAYVTPSIGYDTFVAHGGAVDLMNTRNIRPAWAIIFEELKKDGSDMVKPLARMSGVATPGKAVRFAVASGEEDDDDERTDWAASVNAAIHQIKMMTGIDKPGFAVGDDTSLWVGLRKIRVIAESAAKTGYDATSLARQAVDAAAEAAAAAERTRQRFTLLDSRVRAGVDKIDGQSAAYATVKGLAAVKLELAELFGIVVDLVTAAEGADTSHGSDGGGVGGGNGSGIGRTGPPPPDARWGQEDPGDLEAKIVAKLMAEMGDLEARITSIAVSVGAETFGDPTDVLQFVTNKTVHDAFEVWIGATALVTFGETDVATLEQSLAQELTSAKTGRSIDKSSVVASFKSKNGLPYLLGGDVSKRSEDVPLAAIPDWDTWAGTQGSGGKRGELTKLITRQVDRHTAMFKLLQRGRPEAIALAVAILQEANTWLKSLFDAVSTQYTFLVQTTYGDSPTKVEKAECFKVVASMVKIVFEDLQVVRVHAMSAYLDSNKARCSATYLWATLQELHVMREFQRLDFIRHPSVAPMLMLFLYHNRAPVSHLQALEQTVKDHADTITTLEKEVKSNRSQIDRIDSKIKKK